MTTFNRTVNISFVDPKNNLSKSVKAPIGENILAVAHANDIDLEGACEASLACSTCHVYIQDEFFEKMPEPEEEEEDMLDLAYGLAHNSRLGCQVIVSKDMEGMTVTLPRATRNMQVDKK
ncbi:ferredoxin [Naegleria gruberi]|uniref:Ferredoxin n=1 Tax=Naegleria gruberi TaxID=5762 RepID=D2V7E8_NAEGR|nr:ferredoxin [Naegleria gruberi]EFC47363.1 ferredoxin [Naegleria gruberi]|eukprot:XP_002680107.1 ferredoxin [Naegleria gruberi]